MNLSFNVKALPSIALLLVATTVVAQDTWTIKTQAEWEQNIASAQSITFEQSTVWENWNPVKNIGTKSMGGAPVFLSLGPDNYWMFATYRKKGKEKGKRAKLDGFDIPLFTTQNSNEFQASGGLKQSKAVTMLGKAAT